MKLLVAILLAVVSALAQDAPLRLYSNDIGPLAVSSRISSDGEWTATVRNESGLPLRQLCLCVRPMRAKSECRVILKCSGDRLDPNAFVSFRETVPAHGQGLPKHQIVLLNVFRATPLDGIRKIYVEKLSGGYADAAREQLMAAVVADSGGRFAVTEDPAKADAKLTGMAEARDTGEAYSSAAHFGGMAAGTAVASLGIAGARSSRTEASRTEVLRRSLLVLRLVGPSGETLWGWDDSKTCDEKLPKAKCAIADLVEEANR